MRIKTVAFLILGLGIVGIPTSQSHAQAVGSLSNAAGCWSGARNSELASADDACVPVWIDSLHSKDATNSARARDALVVTGGRAAVDALRADYERAPSQALRRDVIMGMATTGSPEDIAFLVAQLQGPFTGNADIWSITQVAATTLGLLRATAARDALSAVLTRYGKTGFAGRAVAAALASLDLPPCADALRGDRNRELVRIVRQCGPQSMWTSARYHDPSSGGVWSFTNDSWRLGSPTPSDTMTTRVSETVRIAADGRHAKVSVTTSCGMLCGEGWTFSLLRIGNIWRVVSAEMVWVS